MLKTTMTASMGLDRGMMMWKKVRSLVQPSISAASISSCGIECWK